MKKIMLMLFLGIFLVSFASAIDPSFFLKENEPFDLKVSCENAGNFCSGASICNITISSPDSTTIVDNAAMTNLNNGYFNYTLTDSQTSPTGYYSARTGCVDGNASATTTFYFEVTPTGSKQVSILDNALLIFLATLAIIFLILGISFGNPSLGFIGSILLLLAGIYTMIYGFGDVANLYTRGAGIAIIGLGIIFLFSSAYEWLSWNREED